MTLEGTRRMASGWCLQCSFYGDDNVGIMHWLYPAAVGVVVVGSVMGMPCNTDGSPASHGQEYMCMVTQSVWPGIPERSPMNGSQTPRNLAGLERNMGSSALG